MVDFIARLLLFALFILCFYYERKEKKRKEHESWIYDCRQRLIRITHSYRRDCQTIAEKAFARYTNIILHNSYRYGPDFMTYSFLSDYQESIDTLKVDYIDNLAERYSDSNKNLSISDLPDYLIDEYEKSISDIAFAFYDFSYIMRKHIEEAKERN